MFRAARTLPIRGSLSTVTSAATTGSKSNNTNTTRSILTDAAFPTKRMALSPVQTHHRSHQPSYDCCYLSTRAGPADRHGTTIVCVRKNGHVCMMGDGMVSQGSMIVKPNALKLRRIISKSGSSSSTTTGDGASSFDGSSTDTSSSEIDKNVTLVGFAGSTADAFTLLERLEGKLDEYPGQLARSCVELAKGWRTDKYLRRLEASLIVADATCSLELTGNGDVLESHDGVLGVGSGSPYAIGTFMNIYLYKYIYIY
jgi:ATP-dependent HslUV protease, peptidase subunit HslV